MAELAHTRRIEYPDRTIDTFVAASLTADFEITLPMQGYEHISLTWDVIVTHVGTTEAANWYGLSSPVGTSPIQWTGIRAHDTTTTVALGGNPFGVGNGVLYFVPLAMATTNIGATYGVGFWYPEFQFAWTAGDTSAGIVNFQIQRIKSGRGA